MGTEYSEVTQQVLQLIEDGTESWKCAWGQEHLLPRNLITDKPYRGTNAHRLVSTQYDSKYWITEKQAKKKGGSIRDGEEGVRCQFWSTTSKADKGTGQRHWSAFSRYFTVYNVEQCQDLDIPFELSDTKSPRVLEDCERIYRRMSDAPPIEYKGLRPFYCTSRDAILMPEARYFERMEDFYSTMFHELIHATGAPKRLNRPSLYAMPPIGSTDYVREEIVAELGAMYLCTHAGIESHAINNSASYIRMWLGRTVANDEILSGAIPFAQEAADYILNGTH